MIREQQLVIGDCAATIEGLIERLKLRSLLLITGAHVTSQTLQRHNLDFLQKHSHFLKKGVNVAVEEVKQCLQMYRSHLFDAVIAIGGGSVIDLAKGVLYMDRINTRPFFCAVPTTAGSGSEATQFAVVYENLRKVSWDHQNLRPDVAILDAQMTLSLSAAQTAISGADALCQGIESFWSLQANARSRALARQSIQYGLENLHAAVLDPSYDVRANMLIAAHRAGQAINITRTTAVHALSYHLTAGYQVPHGQAVALLLPPLLLFTSEKLTQSNASEIHPIKMAMHELLFMLDVRDAKEASDKIKKLFTDIGLAVSLNELGISKTVIVELLAEVNEERLKNHPVPLDKQALHDHLVAHI